jgi:hypothetical protein
MTLAEIDRYLASLDADNFPLESNRWDKVPSDLVELSGSLLALGRDGARILSMRKAIRALAKPELERRARNERWRVLLRLVPEAGEVAGVSMVDLETTSVRSFVLDEVERARESLESFDVAIGLEVRDSLKRLGLPIARYRTLELGPPRKTLKLNDRGDRLRLTPELVISSSTGIRRPLSDPAKIARDLSAGRRKEVQKRSSAT